MDVRRNKTVDSRKKLLVKRSQESESVREVPVKRRCELKFKKDCLYCKRDTATSLIVQFLKELTQHRTPIENPNIFNFCIIVAEIFAIQNLLSIPFIRRVDDPA